LSSPFSIFMCPRNSEAPRLIYKVVTHPIKFP
jgi:hypothetical protein